MNVQAINEAQFAAALKEHEVVVVEFGAVWCPPCKNLLPILNELAGHYGPRVRFGKVDVDDNPDLAATYGIMGMPTVIVFQNGAPVDKLVGLRPRSAYTAVIDRFMPASA